MLCSNLRTESELLCLSHTDMHIFAYTSRFGSIFLLNNCQYLMSTLMADGGGLKREGDCRFGVSIDKNNGNNNDNNNDDMLENSDDDELDLLHNVNDDDQYHNDDQHRSNDDDEDKTVEISQSWFAEMLKQHIEKAREDYFTHYWSTLDSCFDDVDDSLLKYQNEKTRLLTLESGRLIKAKFAKFNESMESIHGSHRFILLFFDETKIDMRNRCKARISRYEEFFKKYSAFQFSKKNQADYLRIPPLLAETMIDELFVGDINN